MAKKRRWAGPPPPPPATTFAVCNPLDSWHVKFNPDLLPSNETLIQSDRCPVQHVIHLPHRLELLARSGAWFDTAPEAELYRNDVRYRQNHYEHFLEPGNKPRCQATNNDGVQCKKAATEMAQIWRDFDDDGQQPDRPIFCKAHAAKRHFIVTSPGAGLDQPIDNPLSLATLEEISRIAAAVGGVAWSLRDLQGRLAGGDIERVGQMYAKLHDAREKLDAIVSGDRERDAKARRILTDRISRMVDKICVVKKIEGVDVHMTFIRAGGKKQSEMTLEELKGKVNWFYMNYADVFTTDVREWEPEVAHITGVEPGAVRRKEDFEE